MKKILILALTLLFCAQIYQSYLISQSETNYFIETQKNWADFIAHHIKEYFKNIKDELTLIGRLDGVKEMDKTVEKTVWKIAISNIEKDWFAEIYITSKNYDGFRQPDMVFELEGEKPDMTQDEYHALERELEEYAVISGWRDAFSRHKSDFLISAELNLCTDYRGFVSSVPIYKDDNFVGQVSGMFSKKQLFNVLSGVIPPYSTAFFIDHNGDFITKEPVEAYSKTPEKNSFIFNPDFDKSVKELKSSPSFKRIAEDMVSGARGYGNFEFGPGKETVFIYYLPVEWDHNRWSLGIITPVAKIAKERNIVQMVKHRLLFVLSILSVLFIGGFVFREELKKIIYVIQNRSRG